MVWCMTTLALLSLSMALLTLNLPIRRLRLPRIRPGQLLRGCIASLLITIAVILALVAWLP